MKQALLLLLTMLSGMAQSQSAEEVEINGRYELMVACYDTHHVELAQVVEPGKDKFSGVRHVLKLNQQQRAQLRIGMKLKVKGQRKPATHRKMSKAQIRKQMVDHITKREGLPLSCPEISKIMAKIQTVPKKGGKKAPCGHDHGKLELAAVEDDAELVEVSVPEHIEVTELLVMEGGGQ